MVIPIHPPGIVEKNIEGVGPAVAVGKFMIKQSDSSGMNGEKPRTQGKQSANDGPHRRNQQKSQGASKNQRSQDQRIAPAVSPGNPTGKRSLENTQE